MRPPGTRSHAAAAGALGSGAGVALLACLVNYCIETWWETTRDEKLLRFGAAPLLIYAINFIRHGFMMMSLPEHCDKPLLVLATHHKSGSTLGKKLAKAARGVMGHEVFVDMWTRHWRNFSCSVLRYYGCLDREAYGAVRSSGRPHRTVHIIRDPLKLVISAYWYHLHSEDTQFVPGTGPRVLQAVDTLTGLEIEAAAELQSTLQEILEVVEDSVGDGAVLTIGLEDFYDDFNGTTADIFGFFLGPDHPELQRLVTAAVAVSDPSVPHHWFLPRLANRNNPPERRLKALELITGSRNPVWDQVRALRRAFGYVELAPGRFRRPRPRIG